MIVFLTPQITVLTGMPMPESQTQTQVQTQNGSQTQIQSMFPEQKKEYVVMPDGTVVFVNNEQKAETQVIEVKTKERRRPERPEDVCQIVNGTLIQAIEHGNAIYVTCITQGRAVVAKCFKGRNYLFIKSLLAVEIDAIEKIIEALKKAKEKYVTEYELNRLIAWLKQNPELIRQIVKQLNIT